MPEDWQDGGFGLYIHWPFCQAKCPYCDFNSHVHAQIDQRAWEAAYLSEIDRVGAETQGRVLRSVFFGGGTPSLMDARLVDAILTRVRATWPLSNSCEITLEANPTSVEAGRFAGYRAAGVNRVSLGVQALNDEDLRRLGRLHGVNEARAALEIARETFARVSFDLIYARQNQSLADWEAELRQALSYGTEHLSLYQLTIEEGTAFGARFAAGGLKGLPSEDLGADLYKLTQQICGEAGLPAYEISNHARPGEESIHNMLYWTGGDYAGIGPGAHGRLTLGAERWATETELAPLAWLRMVRETGSGERERTILSLADQRAERLLMGLRTARGVPMTLFPEEMSNFYKEVSDLEESEFARISDDRLVLTAKGRPLLNAVAERLLA